MNPLIRTGEVSFSEIAKDGTDRGVFTVKLRECRRR
jgi:hypothetical protein